MSNHLLSAFALFAHARATPAVLTTIRIGEGSLSVVGNTVRNLWRAAARRHGERLAVDELRRLDDRMLRDIGVERLRIAYLGDHGADILRDLHR